MARPKRKEEREAYALLQAVGARIAGLRIERGFTQTALAQVLGVAQGTLSAWETGSVPIPWERMPQLATALAVPEEELLQIQAGAVCDELRKLGLEPVDAEDFLNEMVHAQAFAGRPIADRGEIGKPVREVMGVRDPWAFLVKGVSLHPVADEGDVIFVEPLWRTAAGNLVLVEADGQLAIKRLEQQGRRRRLVSVNGGEELEASEIAMIGRVVLVLRRPE